MVQAPKRTCTQTPGPTLAHIHPPKPNPAKASTHPSYIHTGTSLPTIKDQPAQVSEESTELRSLQKNHFFLFIPLSFLIWYMFTFLFSLELFCQPCVNVVVVALTGKELALGSIPLPIISDFLFPSVC